MVQNINRSRFIGTAPINPVVYEFATIDLSVRAYKTGDSNRVS